MPRWESCFDQVFDVAIVGTGYAGFAAACAAAAEGKRALLMGLDGALLWESGRAFALEAGQLEAQPWNQLCLRCADHGGYNNEMFDGAIVEIVATAMLDELAPTVQPLYYALPVAASCRDGLLQAVSVATKDGLRLLRAHQWLDATETGLLTRLIGADAFQPPRAPATRHVNLFFQHEQLATAPTPSLEPLAPDVTLALLPTAWHNQRCLRITLPGSRPPSGDLVLQAVRSLRSALSGPVADAVMTHFSALPFPLYVAAAMSPGEPAVANLASAVPGLTPKSTATPADRFALGLAAWHTLTQAPIARCADIPDAPPTPSFNVSLSHSVDVAVAGLGTGGAIAALAAARQGASVTGIDLMPFAGGVGSGGGINGYCCGAAGGLFEDIDQKAMEVRDLFACGRPAGGWHHESKKIVFDELFAADGVRFLQQSLAFGVEREGRRLTALHVATHEGPVRIRATAFIDGTADADLCRLGDAAVHGGRPGDQNVLSFSQVMGLLHVHNDRIGMRSVNYDAGHVDPCDPEDLSRGRVRGIRQLLRQRFSALERPCYVAPVIGLRQSRHVDSERDLTLADLVEYRRFKDSIGPTLAFLDTHAVDFEFESDETIFWLWVARSFRVRLWSELPYRMLIPKDLDNVLVACRAAGMSTEAAYSTRMEKDIQRLGEAAGYAAALSLPARGAVREVDINALQLALRQTHALDATPPPEPELPAEMRLQRGLQALEQGRASADLWFVYRNPDASRQAVMALLDHADLPVSWLAACIMALWRDHSAEARLLQAIATREQGAEPDELAVGAFGQRITIPNWLLAIILLRACGTPACLSALEEIAAAPRQLLNVRTAIALTLEHLAAAWGSEAHPRIEAILSQLVHDDPPDRICKPSRSVDLTLQGKPQLSLRNDIGSDTRDDHGWQLHLVVARTRRALGLAPHSQAEDYARDPRAHVRHQFQKLLIHS